MDFNFTFFIQQRQTQQIEKQKIEVEEVQDVSELFF